MWEEAENNQIYGFFLRAQNSMTRHLIMAQMQWSKHVQHFHQWYVSETWWYYIDVQSMFNECLMRAWDRVVDNLHWCTLKAAIKCGWNYVEVDDKLVLRGAQAENYAQAREVSVTSNNRGSRWPKRSRRCKNIWSGHRTGQSCDANSFGDECSVLYNHTFSQFKKSYKHKSYKNSDKATGYLRRLKRYCCLCSNTFQFLFVSGWEHSLAYKVW